MWRDLQTTPQRNQRQVQRPLAAITTRMGRRTCAMHCCKICSSGPSRVAETLRIRTLNGVCSPGSVWREVHTCGVFQTCTHLLHDRNRPGEIDQLLLVRSKPRLPSLAETLQSSIRWLVNEAAEGSAQFTGNAPNKRGSDLRRSLLVGPGCFAKISAGSPSSCVCSKRRKQRMKTIFLWWRVSCGNMSMQAAIPKSRLSTLLSPCTPECDSWTRHWLHSPS